MSIVGHQTAVHPDLLTHGAWGNYHVGHATSVVSDDDRNRRKLERRREREGGEREMERRGEREERRGRERRRERDGREREGEKEE